MPLVNPDKFFADLDQDGEDSVRKKYASRAIYGSDKAPLVEEWLRRKDQERVEHSRSEEIKIARRASEAAERAACAAERDAAAAERAALAAESAAAEARASNQTAKTAKHISIAMLIITAIGILVSAFLG